MIHDNLSKSLKNDQWIEDADVADPDPLPELVGPHILVRPVSVKAKTKGGIYLPDSTKDDIAYLTTVGRVLKVGDAAYQSSDPHKFPNGPFCEEGEYVCYAKHAGQKIKFKGVKLLLIFDDQVIMKVKDPADLDTSFNLTNG